MKVLKTIGTIILVLVVLFFVVALFLPKSVHMERSIIIDKPASLAFRQVNNFKNWLAWSPFQEADPQMKNSYEGPELGVGAITVWDSQKNGSGSMTITESVPYSKIVMSLKLMDRSGSTTSFAFSDQGKSTQVTWATDMSGLSYPVERYIALMMPGMMKKYFDKGLGKLKTVTESMPDPPVIELVQMPDEMVITVTDSCKWSDIASKMGQMYNDLMNYLKIQKVQPSGAPFSIYDKWEPANQFTVFEEGFPVAQPAIDKGRVKFRILPACKAVMGVHYGAYDKTTYLYNVIDEYTKEFRLESAGGPMEVYVVNHMTEPDTSKWKTEIYFPVK